MKSDLDNLLACFWEWIQMTPQLYAIESMRQLDLEEYMFPLWDEIYDKTIELVDSNTTDNGAMDSILTAMALDNETEDILNYIAESGGTPFISRIVNLGVSHMQPNARWQCAELIRRRKPPNGDIVLKQLLLDSVEYVVKRAKNAILHPYEKDCL